MSDNQPGGHYDSHRREVHSARAVHSSSFPRLAGGQQGTTTEVRSQPVTPHYPAPTRLTVESPVPAPMPERQEGPERAWRQAVPASQPARPSADSRRPSVPRARRMKLSVTRIDPWSVTKVSFLLAIAGAIIQVIAVALVWLLLNSIGVFDNVTQIISQTGLDAGDFNLDSVLSFGTVLSATTIFSVFEIILIVVLATIGAFLYNVVSALVGGVHVTLGDD